MGALIEEPAIQTQRRKNERRALDLSVCLYKDRKRASSEVSVADLSLEGFCLKTPISLDSGDSVGFQLCLQHGLVVKGSARVRWNQVAGPPYYHGLEIVRMPFWHRQKLLRYLYPERFNFLTFGDLFLSLAAALTLLFAFRRFWDLHPGIQALAWVYLPSLLIAGSVIWVIRLLLQNSR